MNTVTMSLERYEQLMSKVRKCDELFTLRKEYGGKFTLAIREGTAHLIFEKLLSERPDLAEYKLVHKAYESEYARPINEYNMYAEIEKEEEQEEDEQ